MVVLSDQIRMPEKTGHYPRNGSQMEGTMAMDCHQGA
jgi:hypothetical protein